MIFDTHAHYDDEAFNEDRADLLLSLNSYGIDRVVNVAASMNSCKTTLDLSNKYDFIYAAVGVHPNETTHLTEADIDMLLQMSDNHKVVAIGEIGLDYYWNEPEPDHQKKFFVRQLELARNRSLPVIIHSRDAAADTLDIMKREHAEEIGGVIHCFSYSADMARTYVDMGFYIGVGGVATFKNGRKLKEVIEAIPLSRIVLETDCPYLSPEPFRGKRNSSINLPYVVKAIADIKGITTEEVEDITYNNAMEMYRIK